ncbi:MAG TPA: signal peptide peptidase SppA, partial [Thermodesulfobacteriota bacterium]|nr:signal peptide peptidase SppA [Thermodesulfobacteriota bacterium]
MTIWDIDKICLHASINPSVAGVLIKIKELRTGLGRAEAIRRNISGLREAGKRVFVYLESPGNLEYMIASSADKIFIPPWSMINLIGLKAEVTFFKNALDKLGVEAEFKALGEYKSAAETFTRESMSEPHRNMLDSIIGDLYLQFISNMAKGRGIEEEKMKGLVDSGPFAAKEALNERLVDEIGYEDDLERKIEESLSLGDKPRKIRAEGFLRAINVRERLRAIKERIMGSINTIAVVSDSGIITLGESKGTGEAKALGSQTLIEILRKVSRDRGIKAIVLRILSPGGSGVASDLIRHEVKVISEKKPVVVSMSDVAASGGYLIAVGGKKIVAEPLTLTGSIGVISGKFNLKSFLTKLGITKESVTRGERASMFSSYRGFTDGEEEKLLGIMKSFYEGFVNEVADARHMDFKNTEELARGRVWTGKQAKEVGLIDELGGLKEAIQLAKKEAGIPEDVLPTVKFISKPRGLQLTGLGKGF